MNSGTEAAALAPPSNGQRLRELLVGRDVARLAVRTPRLLRRDDARRRRAVILTSGFGGTDTSLNPLRWFLRSIGHDARPVGIGRISDDVEALSERVAERAADLSTEVGEPVALVGWSIGGVLSREAARLHPDVIDRVITFGTPVIGGPSYTALASRYSEEYLEEIRALIDEREETPIRVPITAIRSRNDGVVNPAACIDNRSPNVENIEVGATHVGLAYDPDVWDIAADRLDRN